MFPNFFIVGTPKSGTTSLFNYLDEHSDVFMCPAKEPNYFSYKDIVQQNLYYAEKGTGNQEEYGKLFKDVTSEKVIGEASVSYLFYSDVASRIKASVPGAKIIIILRNPISRGFSHYLMDSRLGYVDLSFDHIVYQRTDHPLLALYYQQFVDLGFYYEQVKRYLDIFGVTQVKIFINEDLKEDMLQVILSVYDFLDIDSSHIPDLKKKYNVYQYPRNAFIKYLYHLKCLRSFARSIIPNNFVETVKSNLLLRGEKPQLSIDTSNHLKLLYRDNILQTANLIGRDLSHWCGGVTKVL